MSTPNPLPRLLVLTDRMQAAPRSLVDVVRDAATGGARAVVLREKDLSRGERTELAARLETAIEMLIVASDASIPAHGVHLAATDPLPDPRPALVGRSCHDAGEIARAAAEGCDYVMVSPVFASVSKPGYGPPLGVDGLRDLVDGADIPVYALGGITPERVAACTAAGAYGIAVMGEIMRARDPAATTAVLVAAMTAVPAGGVHR